MEELRRHQEGRTRGKEKGQKRDGETGKDLGKRKGKEDTKKGEWQKELEQKKPGRQIEKKRHRETNGGQEKKGKFPQKSDGGGEAREGNGIKDKRKRHQ